MAVLEDPHWADGTPYDPPENPLIAKYKPDDCDFDYKCMWCSKCPLGDHFKISEEDRDVYKTYLDKRENYHRSHGGISKVVFSINQDELNKLLR